MSRRTTSLTLSLRRDRDEHMDVIARQHAFDDGHAEFLADLPDDVADTLAQGAAKDLVAVLGDPNDVKPVIVDGVFSGVVAHSRLWKMGLHASADPFSRGDYANQRGAEALRLQDGGLNRNADNQCLEHSAEDSRRPVRTGL